MSSDYLARLQLASATLSSILDVLDRDLNFDTRMLLYDEAAKRLSMIAGKEPPWTARYVASVVNGNMLDPGKNFIEAIDILAIELDSNRPLIHTAKPVTVMVPRASGSNIDEHTLVVGNSRICANPGCTIKFLPNVYNRKYCYSCRPVKR